MEHNKLMTTLRPMVDTQCACNIKNTSFVMGDKRSASISKPQRKTFRLSSTKSLNRYFKRDML